MKITRKIFSALLALCMVMLPCATAFAADAASVPVAEEANVTPRQSIGRLLAGRSNNFYGDGYIEVYLDSGNSWADIQAGTGPSSCTGMVTISVKFPDGQWHKLGSVMANADHTDYVEFSYLPKGTYTFLFENTTNDWIQVYANIYDWLIPASYPIIPQELAVKTAGSFY